MHSRLIIRLCRHTFPDGRHCHGPAVRGRACCRHHLDARTRQHNMARARRFASFPRLYTSVDRSDVDLNRIEIMRVINAGHVDFATARTMLWAMDLTAATFPTKPANRPRRAHNPNGFYYVPIKPLFSGSCMQNLSQVPENNDGEGRGVALHSQRGNSTRERVGFLQPRQDAE